MFQTKSRETAETRDLLKNWTLKHLFFLSHCKGDKSFELTFRNLFLTKGILLNQQKKTDPPISYYLSSNKLCWALEAF